MVRRSARAAVCLLALVAVTVSWASGENNGGFAGWDKGFKFRSADDRFELNINNRVQVRYTYEDFEQGEDEGSFRLRRYKFKMDGHVYEHWKYKLQVSFASGSVLGQNDALLEDAWFQYTQFNWFQPRIGQTKVFFARQALISSGKLQFVDRALGLGLGEVPRQTGITLIGNNKAKTFEYDVGVYNGEGVNRKANPGNHYLWVGRVVFTPFGEYKLAESSLDYPHRSKLALGLKASFNTQEATTETVLIAPPGGGEVIEQELPDEPQSDVTRYGFEYAYKIKGFNTTGEYFRIKEDPEGGEEVETDAWYVQIGYLLPNRKVDFAVRLSEAKLDTPGDPADREAGVAVSYYISKHNYMLQADYRDLEFESDPSEDIRVARVQFQMAF